MRERGGVDCHRNLGARATPAGGKSMIYSLIPATLTDKEWLEKLRRAAYADLFTATWGGWDEPRHLRHFAESWDRGSISLIHLDEPVGMIQLFDEADTLEIGEIQIWPARQSGGIGSRVIQDVISRAQRGGKATSLRVGLKNERA